MGGTLFYCAVYIHLISLFHCSIILLPMPMKWLYSKRIWVQALVGMKVLFSCHVQDGPGALYVSSCPVGTDSILPEGEAAEA